MSDKKTEMDGMGKKVFAYLTLAAALLFGPSWAPHIQQWGSHQVFLRSDSLVWLGLTILGGIICSFILPRASVHAVDYYPYKVKRYGSPAVVAYLACVLLFTYGINQSVLHAFLGSADEHSCYFLAKCLQLKKWWVESHPASEFFNVVHVGNRDGKWFSVYPPGWPLIYAFGLKFKIENWLNPVLSVMAMGMLLKSFSRIGGLMLSRLTVIVVTLTPFYLYTSASYFSHSTCLFAIASALYCYLKWYGTKHSGWQVFWAFLCAFAIGYGLLTRYLTMAAFIMPFLIYHLNEILKKRERVTAAHKVFVLVLFLMSALVLLHNYAVTGKPFKAPNKYDKSWERLGFKGDYQPIDGLIFIVARLFYLMDWAPPILLFYFLISLRHLRTMPAQMRNAILGGIGVAFGYFFYFSWGGNQFGPRYYYEAFPFYIFAAFWEIRRQWSSGDMMKRKLILGFLAFALANNIYLLHKQGDFYSVAFQQRKNLYVEAERQIKGKAIVFIQGFLGKELVMSQDDAVRNDPALNTRILYARDLGERNAELRKYFPERSFFLGSYDRENEKTVLTPIA